MTHNENDYLNLREDIRYGLVVIRCKLRKKIILEIIAAKLFGVLFWGKEFFKRDVVVIVSENSLTVDYRTKAGQIEKRAFEYDKGKPNRIIE